MPPKRNPEPGLKDKEEEEKDIFTLCCENSALRHMQ